MTTIYKKFRFEAAHRLPNVPPGHKCGRLHGHSFQATIHLKGEVNLNTGMLLDFQDIKDAFSPFLALLDHNFLNEIPGLENPTSENLSKWIWDKLFPLLPDLHKVDVAETCTSGATYRGDEWPQVLYTKPKAQA